MTIFGVPWDELELEDIELFLGNAGGEPLTWEAKGTTLPSTAAIAKQIGGFSNAVEGGYLLLGFERDGEAWRASGLEFPDDDPPVWISSIVQNRLRPAPRVDVRDWPVAAKRASVVRVEPIAEPPCITTDGQVFERVSGATIPVRDAAGLRRLYERGAAAAEQAEASAERAAEVLGQHKLETPPFLELTFAVAPAARAGDISARLFTSAFLEALMRAVAALPDEPLFVERSLSQQGFTAYPRQDSIIAATVGDRRQSWRLRAAWDGSVAARLLVRPNEEHESRALAEAVFDDAVRPMATTVETLVRALGGHGRGHLVLLPSARQFSLVHGPLTKFLPWMLPIQRWTESDTSITDDVLDSMKRELLRAAGIPAWEPGSAST